ncbi:uncharacterized protein YALI1_B06514g [Yarrowia lipolytica]|uniref:Uncharacterized protein n=1 Tax=Yarrowia lipolytica TaxID=4952 RepID=A0A1D8N6H4_YARLL|nr:hypothetical protein YALI1_B06514g [Yarrowia lipolytica]
MGTVLDVIQQFLSSIVMDPGHLPDWQARQGSIDFMSRYYDPFNRDQNNQPDMVELTGILVAIGSCYCFLRLLCQDPVCEIRLRYCRN